HRPARGGVAEVGQRGGGLLPLVRVQREEGALGGAFPRLGGDAVGARQCGGCGVVVVGQRGRGDEGVGVGGVPVEVVRAGQERDRGVSGATDVGGEDCVRLRPGRPAGG